MVTDAGLAATRFGLLAPARVRQVFDGGLARIDLKCHASRRRNAPRGLQLPESLRNVPTRTAYVMAVVTPAERTAAASFTAVPRSLVGALSPTLSRALFAAGWTRSRSLPAAC